MKKSNDNHRELPLVATAILSLALTLPLLSNQTIAEERNNLEQTTTREVGRDTRADYLRFPATGRAERSATVTWADLDLNRPAGLEQLYLRLTQATTTVCSPRADIRDAAMNRDRKACLATAMDQAVNNVGHLGLEQLHASRTGRSLPSGQEVAER
ncbi:MAG: UrcA family protein [Haliea sp.]